jgi:predicted transcriptional regulator of viral defense system
MRNRPRPNQNQRRLYELAESQGGYFTAGQAGKLGYSASKRNYHVGAGNWVREARGIFRLALFPRPERPDLILWWLWSRDRSGQPLGVYSHRTALSLHDLTDVMPARIDMIVPRSFRRGAPIPRVLNLHYADLSPAEIDNIEHIPVTTPLRTIVDLWKSGEMLRETLRSAFESATDQGKITTRQIQAAKKYSDWEEIVTALMARGQHDR